MPEEHMEIMIEQWLCGQLSREESESLLQMAGIMSELQDNIINQAKIHALLDMNHSIEKCNKWRSRFIQPVKIQRRKNLRIVFQPIYFSLILFLLAGMVATGMAWALSRSRPHARIEFEGLLDDAQFEHGQRLLPTGFPREFKQWSGDPAEVIRLQLPGESKKLNVLQFQQPRAENKKNHQVPIACDVFQMVDLAELGLKFNEPGDRFLELSCEFLDARDDRFIPARFFCSIYLFRSDTNPLQASWPEFLEYAIASSTRPFVSRAEDLKKSNHGWQKVSTRILVPDDSRYAIIHISAGGLGSSSGQMPAFGSLFADNARLELHSQPRLPRYFVKGGSKK